VDQIKTQVDSLSELSDEQVTELQSSIVREFEMVEGQEPSPEVVDAMTSLADMLDTVNGETKRREAAAEELAARAAEATSRVEAATGDEEVPMGEDMPVEAAPAEEAPAEEPMESEEPMDAEAKETESDEDMEKKKQYAADDSDVASTTQVEGSELSTETVEGTELSADPEEPTIAPETEQEEQAPVTAAAEEGFSAPADRQPVIEVVERATVAITAGADIPGYTAGTSIADMSEVAVAMEKRIHSLRRVNGGDGEQHIVASINTLYPEARTLGLNPEDNQSKIEAVVGQEALVASGGHAAPFEVKYDIYAQGSTTVRPLRDSLPKFQADRGGVRYVTPPSFAAGTYDTAVGVWTAANDSATTPSPASKTSLTVSAAAELTAQTDAVTLQLQFGNLMTRAYPELISRHNELALVQHAREAEENIVSKINDGSTAVTTTNLIGFGRDFLVQVRRAAVAYRSRHRIDPSTQLQAVIPFWVYDAMAADLALSMPGDNTLGISKSEIDGYLANSNVTLTPIMDNTNSTSPSSVFATQTAAALLEFPDSFKWFLFAEGTFLFLDGGTLDLGIIRDSTLVGTNDYKMFIETFEGVAKVGIESLAITSTISINGAAAALRDTTGGTAAATIEL
jgi:hypothetical protein